MTKKHKRFVCYHTKMTSKFKEKNDTSTTNRFSVVYHFEFVPQISLICADKLYESAAICVICGTLYFQTEILLVFLKGKGTSFTWKEVKEQPFCKATNRTKQKNPR